MARHYIGVVIIKMKITKTCNVTITDGDLEIRMGNSLTGFYYKGLEKFTFRTDELKTLALMTEQGQKELAVFYDSLKSDQLKNDR